MGFYVTATFTLPKNHDIKHVSKAAKKIHDPCKIRRKDENIYEIIIYELTLQESFPILDKLKSKYSIIFRITHGEY